MSLATYKFKRAPAPQVSLEFPVHGMLHLEESTWEVPLPSTTPHQPVNLSVLFSGRDAEQCPRRVSVAWTPFGPQN